MRAGRILIIACLLLGLCMSNSSLAQQNLRLTLNGLQFSDSLVTIAEGDSGTWVFSGQGVQPHNLNAAGEHPGLFSSGPPTFDAFEFTYTFDTFDSRGALPGSQLRRILATEPWFSRVLP